MKGEFCCFDVSVYFFTYTTRDASSILLEILNIFSLKIITTLTCVGAFDRTKKLEDKSFSFGDFCHLMQVTLDA